MRFVRLCSWECARMAIPSNLELQHLQPASPARTAGQIPSLGPIRSALAVALQIPHRFRTKSGFVTVMDAELERFLPFLTLNGLCTPRPSFRFICFDASPHQQESLQML
jgi:hypothetical protein